MSAAAGDDVPPECVDQPELANCELIVYARLCSNSYYSSFCCASCARHSRGNDRFSRLGWRWERRREVRALCLKHWSRFRGLGLKHTNKTHPTLNFCHDQNQQVQNGVTRRPMTVVKQESTDWDVFRDSTWEHYTGPETIMSCVSSLPAYVFEISYSLAGASLLVLCSRENLDFQAFKSSKPFTSESIHLCCTVGTTALL